MATATAPSKLRRRSFDRLRQKLWAVPAHMRLKLETRGQQPRAHRRRTAVGR